MVKRSKTLGRYMPEIFAVDADEKKDKFSKCLTENNFLRYCCAKEKCSRRSCIADVHGVVNSIANFVKGNPVDHEFFERRVPVDPGKFCVSGVETVTNGQKEK